MRRIRVEDVRVGDEFVIPSKPRERRIVSEVADGGVFYTYIRANGHQSKHHILRQLTLDELTSRPIEHCWRIKRPVPSYVRLPEGL